MKINSVSLNPINPYSKQQRAMKTSQATSNFADKLEISAQAKEMQVQSSYNTERSEKLSKLKEQIESGTYQVNARKVAEDLLKYYRH